MITNEFLKHNCYTQLVNNVIFTGCITQNYSYVWPTLSPFADKLLLECVIIFMYDKTINWFLHGSLLISGSFHFFLGITSTKLRTSHASSGYRITQIETTYLLSLIRCIPVLNFLLWSVGRITHLYHSIYHNIFIRK